MQLHTPYKLQFRNFWQFLRRIALWFCGIVLYMVLWKILFILINKSLYSEFPVSSYASAVKAGFDMDLSVSAYLAVLPSLAAAVAIAAGTYRWWQKAMTVYTYIIFFILTLIELADSLLYSHWQFKLDTTPIHYFMSSPSDAMASINTLQLCALVVIWIFASVDGAALLLWICRKLRLPEESSPSPWGCVAMVLFTPLLIIPIRGGVSVATMNVSSAYFSEHTPLNHAAVNPAFSLLYSLTHPAKFGEDFQYFTQSEAIEMTRQKEASVKLLPADDVRQLLTTNKPDVYVIILESFSSHLFASAGGQDVATRLDSVARSGLLFTNIYASGYRTDRGIPSILSGWPSLPTASVMKYTSKAEHLPSWPALLVKHGYETVYYYGGDDRFTNMRSYLRGAGFSSIIHDTDFPLSQRLSKWGVPDHLLFERVLHDLNNRKNTQPLLAVIQTSSSHEPYEVDRQPDSPDQPAAVNAFKYTDTHTAAFLNALRKQPRRWQRSLIVLVPDHYGAWPIGLPEGMQRHKVPLIFTGGALATTGRIATTGNQTDIGPTLLGAMGISYTSNHWAYNLMAVDPVTSYAWGSGREYAFYVSPRDTVTLNLVNGAITLSPNTPPAMADTLKALLQTLSIDLSKL